MIGITFTASRTVTPTGLAVMHGALQEIATDHGGEDKLQFISGAADGGDTYLALTCLFMFPEHKHLVCIPDYHHNQLLVSTLRVWQTYVHSPYLQIVETGLPPLDRNGYMLDRGKYLYGFPSTSKEQARGSGTWACIRWARKRVMPIRIYPLNGEEPWTENI